jgi:hypothetical protein
MLAENTNVKDKYERKIHDKIFKNLENPESDDCLIVAWQNNKRMKKGGGMKEQFINCVFAGLKIGPKYYVSTDIANKNFYKTNFKDVPSTSNKIFCFKFDDIEDMKDIVPGCRRSNL